MSILIKGMEMPVEGLVTVNIHSDGLVYVYGAYPTELHEAVCIPTPHGRLIDADAPIVPIERLWQDAELYGEDYRKIKRWIKNAPTIIEAEKGVTKEACWLQGADVRCSGCGYKLQTTGLPQYCPNCGAKMKG